MQEVYISIYDNITKQISDISIQCFSGEILI